MNPRATENAAEPGLPLESQSPQTGPAANADLRPEEASAAIGRLEGLVREIRGALDASAREREHREFSIARLLAAIAQGLAIGILLWAALDLLFQGESAAVIIKLSFATVLQLMALTAFYVSRPQR